jgi:hypothetical protein
VTDEKKRFWEQSVPIKQSIHARTYRCPACNVILFSVPESLPVPQEKIDFTCKNGHKVRVPKYNTDQIITPNEEIGSC